jgi:hypothetical protein
MTGDPDAKYEFKRLEQCVEPGPNATNIRKLEEDWIRTGGGPQNQGGKLLNDRYEMNDAEYKSAGGNIPKPTK